MAAPGFEPGSSRVMSPASYQTALSRDSVEWIRTTVLKGHEPCELLLLYDAMGPAGVAPAPEVFQTPDLLVELRPRDCVSDRVGGCRAPEGDELLDLLLSDLVTARTMPHGPVLSPPLGRQPRGDLLNGLLALSAI